MTVVVGTSNGWSVTYIGHEGQWTWAAWTHGGSRHGAAADRAEAEKLALAAWAELTEGLI